MQFSAISNFSSILSPSSIPTGVRRNSYPSPFTYVARVSFGYSSFNSCIIFDAESDPRITASTLVLETALSKSLSL